MDAYQNSKKKTQVYKNSYTVSEAPKPTPIHAWGQLPIFDTFRSIQFFTPAFDQEDPFKSVTKLIAERDAYYEISESIRHGGTIQTEMVKQSCETEYDALRKKSAEVERISIAESATAIGSDVGLLLGFVNPFLGMAVTASCMIADELEKRHVAKEAKELTEMMEGIDERVANRVQGGTGALAKYLAATKANKYFFKQVLYVINIQDDRHDVTSATPANIGDMRQIIYSMLDVCDEFRTDDNDPDFKLEDKFMETIRVLLVPCRSWYGPDYVAVHEAWEVLKNGENVNTEQIGEYLLLSMKCFITGAKKGKHPPLPSMEDAPTNKFDPIYKDCQAFKVITMFAHSQNICHTIKYLDYSRITNRFGRLMKSTEISEFAAEIQQAHTQPSSKAFTESYLEGEDAYMSEALGVGVAEDVALAGASRCSTLARFGKGLFKAGVALGATAAAVDILYQGWKIFQEVKDHCDSVKHMNEMEEATVGFYTGILDGAAKRFFHTELVNNNAAWPLRFDRPRLNNIQAYWDEIGDGLQYKNQMLKFYVTMKDGYWIKEFGIPTIPSHVPGWNANIQKTAAFWFVNYATYSFTVIVNGERIVLDNSEELLVFSCEKTPGVYVWMHYGKGRVYKEVAGDAN